ncbi:SDH family Clp fold serine proteinase [Streptococcus uberis]|uniref:SDH family Clp fold serine proteinase n=1 Tax=Streptococcus uberis TaxID=1349 RepID=UPI00193A107E|nr:serine protease [Streptococcus uberis]
MENGGNWSDILNETISFPTRYDAIRHKYIVELEKTCNRNIICYYSGWQQNKKSSIDINDSDMEGFMSAMKGIDKNKGLTLLLHTPGGDPNAAESIVSYLREVFNDDIEVVVPHMAMSAGTMISCASKCIWMGKHSSLGPVDPQISGLPAYNIVTEFAEAKEELQKDDSNHRYWSLLLSKYPPAFVKFAQDAVQLSDELIEKWLTEVMFKDENNRDKILKIVSSLNEHENTKVHARHLNAKTAMDIGLNVKMIEENQEFQNAVLSLHHALMITLQQTPVSKIIESSQNAYIVSDVD